MILSLLEILEDILEIMIATMDIIINYRLQEVIWAQTAKDGFSILFKILTFQVIDKNKFVSAH